MELTVCTKGVLYTLTSNQNLSSHLILVFLAILYLKVSKNYFYCVLCKKFFYDLKHLKEYETLRRIMISMINIFIKVLKFSVGY